MISYITTHQKKVANMLLLVFLFNLINPISLFAKPIPEKTIPISEQLAKYVNPFTGDFSYSVPLLSISGPNGEVFPINASYSGGIKMNQESSWIGLGWDFNPGEISRNVNGYPDDWKAQIATVTKKSSSINENRQFKVYGPIHYKDFDYIDSNSTMDIYESNRLLNYTESFEFPDYDDYNVSGIGTMRPHMFEYATLVSKNYYSNISTNRNRNEQYLFDSLRNPNYKYFKKFEKQPSFCFDNELSVYSTPNYNKLVNSNLTNYFKYDFYTPKEVSAFTNDDKYYKVNNLVIDNNTPTKGKQVFYFTNKQINEEFNTLKNTSNFLEYNKNSNNEIHRPIDLFPQDGIGAFQVVDIDGTTYHYSLPVYTSNNNQFNFIFKDETIGSNFNPYKQINPDQEFNTSTKNGKYAISWKLTAITGPDFVDVNHDGIANNGDKGYWIVFDYGKWVSDFNWREPFYGCYASNIQNKSLPTLYNNIYSNSSRNSENNLFREGSYSTGSSEQYYLNSIETATQKSIFIKDIRNDGHSIEISGITKPQLKLSKIVLFNKSDVENINFENASTASLGGNVNFGNSNNIIDINDYESLKSTSDIENKSLKTIEFTFDYSLCKGVYNNSTNNVNTTFITRSPNSNDGYQYVNSVSNTSQLYQSGKLTLLEINFKEQKGVHINPSFKFDYDQNNPLKNPNYNPDQQDFWGYFKSDYHSIYRGHYTTFESSKNVDAWSLKKIITPIGSEIEINYESDKYNSIGYDENEDFINPNNSSVKVKKGIQRTFQIYSISDGSTISSEGKAFFLDNDVFNFVFNSNEEKQNYTIVRLPIEHSNGYIIPFECGPGAVIDRPAINYYLNSNISPSNGNYLKILKNSDADCNSTPIEFNSAIYKRAGFLMTYLTSVYGGGLRVRNISIRDITKSYSNSLNFNYTNGVASAEPDNFAAMNDIKFELSSNTVGSDRHIPTLNVGYSSVDIINNGIYEDISTMSSDDYIGKTTLEFNNYQKNIKVDEKPLYTFLSKTNPPNYNTLNYEEGIIRDRIIVENFNTNLYGKIKRKLLFDKNNNAIDLYSYDYTQVPTFREVFYKSYTHGNTNMSTNFRSTNFVRKISEKIDYECLLKEVIHYKNGIIVDEVLTKPENYNVFTGQCEQVMSKDISGRVLQTISTPAYILNPNINMGVKINSSSLNKNMLIQNGKTVEKVLQNSTLTNSSTPNLTTLNSASVSNWSNISSVRKYNPYTQEFFTENNITVPNYLLNTKRYNGNSNEALWDLNSQLVLFDENNKILEIKGISEKRNSVKYNSLGMGVLAECKNATYPSFTFTSFEEQLQLNSNNYHSGGEVRIGNGDFRIQQNTNVKAHSGSFISTIPSNQQYGANYKSNVNSTDGITPNRTYIAKVWVHENSDPSARLFIHLVGKVNGSTFNDYKEVRKDNLDNLKIGQWILMSVQINIPQNFTTTNNNEFLNVGLAKNTTGSESYFDDLMFSPIDASLTGYVINPFSKQREVIIGNDGLTMRFEYDAAGRNTYSYKETKSGMKVISRNKYNFSR
ncbi:MAG: hypothetical protein K9I48_06075 [Sphingobacteriales bacterium]|nr:hypothetical protein [Sphingobacteriales bacterium]